VRAARRRRSLAALVLGLVLVATVAACGGSGKHAQPAQPAVTVPPVKQGVSLGKTAYITAMRPLGKRLAVSIESIYPIVETTPGSTISNETAATIEKTRVVVAAVLASAAAIVPPAPIRLDHQRLVKGLSDLQAELDGLIHFLQKGGPDPFGTYARLPGLQTIAQARVSIETKGYAIG
jgi:hypothetical protein